MLADGIPRASTVRASREAVGQRRAIETCFSETALGNASDAARAWFLYSPTLEIGGGRTRENRSCLLRREQPHEGAPFRSYDSRTHLSPKSEHPRRGCDAAARCRPLLVTPLAEACDGCAVLQNA